VSSAKKRKRERKTCRGGSQGLEKEDVGSSEKWKAKDWDSRLNVNPRTQIARTHMRRLRVSGGDANGQNLLGGKNFRLAKQLRLKGP